MTAFPPDNTAFVDALNDRQLFFNDQAVLRCAPGMP
jgi:hypothetical protein